jgi:hypothetical protein
MYTFVDDHKKDISKQQKLIFLCNFKGSHDTLSHMEELFVSIAPHAALCCQLLTTHSGDDQDMILTTGIGMPLSQYVPDMSVHVLEENTMIVHDS